MDDDIKSWIETRIIWSLPTARTDEPKSAIHHLADAYEAMRSGRGNVFGMYWRGGPQPELQERCETGIRQWHAAFSTDGDLPSAQLVADLARRIGFSIEMERVPLLCEPLGAMEHLSDTEKELVNTVVRMLDDPERLFERWTRNNRVIPNTKGLLVEVGVPDNEALYRTAMLFERDVGYAFPPILAALLSIVNGVSISESDDSAREEREELAGPHVVLWSSGHIRPRGSSWVIGSVGPWRGEYSTELELDVSEVNCWPVTWWFTSSRPSAVAESLTEFFQLWIAADLDATELISE